jgi:hypothetical protein
MRKCPVAAAVAVGHSLESFEIVGSFGLRFVALFALLQNKPIAIIDRRLMEVR